MARTLEAMGRREEARICLERIVAEKYQRPNLGTYYQALAQKALGHEAEARALLDTLEGDARGRSSKYLLALVEAQKAGKKATGLDAAGARVALREAQRSLAQQ